MRPRRLIGVLIAAALVLAGCGLAPGGAEIDGTWRLTAGEHDGDPLPVPAEITLRIDGSEVGGVAACNQYGGSIERTGDEVTIGALTMTEMGCDPPRMEAEAAYIAALSEVTTLDRAGNRLVLSGPEVELAFTLVPSVADADLVGPVWRLDSLITGDTVSSVLGDPATLELGDDGTIAGSTGCRTFDGDYTVDGGQVRVTGLVNDDRACPPGIVAQDEHVLAVIGDGFGFEIDGERLTLTSGDRGLGYVAE